MVPAKKLITCRVREGFWVDCLPDKETHTKKVEMVHDGFWVDCLPDKETHTISSKDYVTFILLILLYSVFFAW